jgi:serine/threonine-protein kinase
MEILCTRPGCPRPLNSFQDLDEPANLKTAQQKYCTACGMPLILAGRYLPYQLLGEGGFGRAFLSRDRYTPAMRSCVVKQFQPSGNLSQQELAIAQSLFEREAAVLEQLGNKNERIPDLFAFFPLIVPNPGSGRDDQFFYLVQEFITGQTLEEELAAKGPFSEAEVRLVLTALLEVLQFVHENGSIHRDIKPANIMRDREGRFFLLDFGAVKQVAAGAGGNPQGRSTGIYSMGFAPPEQMAGAQVYPATDLYALAATCLNLLTGKPPEDLYDAYHNSWNWRPHAPQVSQRLAAILARLLLPAAKDRFQSAREVLAALHAAPVSPPPPSGSTQLQAPPKPMPPVAPRPRFSVLEILMGAAFTGFEGSLLALALTSLLSSPGTLAALLATAGLVFLQYRRIIEGKDLLIIGVVSLLLVLFAPGLNPHLAIPQVVFFAILGAAGAVAITTLFRLIYQLLRRFL